MTCESQVMKKTHYYLVDTSVIIPGAAVSELEFKIIHEDQPFMVKDLKVSWILLQLGFTGTKPMNDLGVVFELFQIIPLPVWHGSNYRSLGFRFGDVCYIR